MKTLTFIASVFFMYGFTMPLEWKMPANSNHTGFIIEQRPQKGGGWVELIKLGPDERIYTVTEDRPGQRCYRIRSFNEEAKSGPSQVKCGYNEEENKNVSEAPAL